MHATLVDRCLSDVLDGRRLLTHPFYRRWEEGTLTRGELARYAEQYRHVEAALPGVLGTIVDGLPDGPARARTEANLEEELGTPRAHRELFESFAQAVGASAAVAPGPATAALVETQRRAADAGPVDGLCALAVYEVQAPVIASSKAQGLRAHYGLDHRATAFWDVHAEMEVDHARWLTEALASLSPSAAQVEAAATASAEAWWAFLDERQAALVTS